MANSNVKTVRTSSKNADRQLIFDQVQGKRTKLLLYNNTSSTVRISLDDNAGADHYSYTVPPKSQLSVNFCADGYYSDEISYYVDNPTQNETLHATEIVAE